MTSLTDLTVIEFYLVSIHHSRIRHRLTNSTVLS